MPLGPAITSRSNARVKALREAFSGVARKPGELVGIEGATLIAEALSSGQELGTVFVRQGSESVLDRAALHRLQATQPVLLTADVFDSAMDSRSPQGIAATFVIPESFGRSSAWPVDDGAPVRNCFRSRASDLPCPPFLILEAIQDPGNMGTLLRSAEAFGVSLVQITTNSVNVWSPKVIRASAGSVFRVPMMRILPEELPEFLRKFPGCTYAAVPPLAGGKSLLDTNFDPVSAIIIGNEGAGISPPALAAVTDSITIPCATESLNAAVAGAILLYEFHRQSMLSHSLPSTL